MTSGEDVAAFLKRTEIEGARRRQTHIIALLIAQGHMDIAPKILALNPEAVCEGSSIKEIVTLGKP